MADFSRYLITTDLDGTFFGPGGTMVERNLVAIERFKAGGGLFTYATGRLHLNIGGIIRDSASLVNAPAVLCNGAYLYDFQKNVAFEQEMMDEDVAAALFAFTNAHFADIQYRIATPTGLRVKEITNYLALDIPDYASNSITVDPAGNWPVDDWYKIVFRDEPARLAPLRAALRMQFGTRLGITASSNRILEIQSPGCNKAKGIDKLRRHCGAGRILIACGDYENDLEMLGEADIAVCPENALPAVKSVAHYTLCHCKDGLIADLIEKIEAGIIVPKEKT